MVTRATLSLNRYLLSHRATADEAQTLKSICELSVSICGRTHNPSSARCGIPQPNIPAKTIAVSSTGKRTRRQA